MVLFKLSEILDINSLDDTGRECFKIDQLIHILVEACVYTEAGPFV